MDGSNRCQALVSKMGKGAPTEVRAPFREQAAEGQFSTRTLSFTLPTPVPGDVEVV